MSDYLGAQEDVNAARASTSAAVREGRSIRLEGPAEDAYLCLEAANGWLREQNVVEARREMAEALDRLREYESGQAGPKRRAGAPGF